MKTSRKKIAKYLCALALLLFAVSAFGQAQNNNINSAQPKQPKFLLVAVTTGAATQVVSTNLFTTTATFYGWKTLSATTGPTANTAPCFAGFVDANGDSGVTPGQPAFCVTIATGAAVPWDQCMGGTKLDLSKVYVTGTTGDKVLIVYTQ